MGLEKKIHLPGTHIIIAYSQEVSHTSKLYQIWLNSTKKDYAEDGTQLLFTYLVNFFFFFQTHVNFVYSFMLNGN